MTAADETELSRAIRLAALAHEDQRDKAGAAYVLHPLRMLFAVSDRARVAAVLHDVIEDSELTPDALLAEGIGATNVEAVRLLSRAEGMSYGEFVERLAAAEGDAGAIAREVKVADLRDNLGRMSAELRRARPDLVARYEAALAALALSEGPGSPPRPSSRPDRLPRAG